MDISLTCIEEIAVSILCIVRVLNTRKLNTSDIIHKCQVLSLERIV
jgi:hypothetical protein